MKILVTGGNGFIGRNLSTFLRDAGHDVAAPGRAELNLTDAPAVEAYLAARSFDVVLHTATHNATANSKVDVSTVLQTNLAMHFNLARASKLFGRMAFFGSGAEFDRRFWRAGMREDEFGPAVPLDDYGLSKYLMTLHALSSSNVWNLRLFGCFGPHEDWEIRFISNACCRAMWDLPVTIRQDVEFDYLWVGDLCRIAERFLHAPPPERVINVCSGVTFRLTALAQMVLDAAGKRLPIEVANPGLGRTYGGANERLRAAWPDVQLTPHAVAIPQLYDWYAKRREHYPLSRLVKS